VRRDLAVERLDADDAEQDRCGHTARACGLGERRGLFACHVAAARDAAVGHEPRTILVHDKTFSAGRLISFHDGGPRLDLAEQRREEAASKPYRAASRR
jgi:hypothetical protein